MKNIILFDQNILHYRQSVYRGFQKIFRDNGFNLIVYFDETLNDKTEDDLFKPLAYNFVSFRNCAKQHEAKIVIQFVWPRYLFIPFFMIWARINGIKTILWSHGAYLKNPYKFPNRQIHIFRHFLAKKHIIYSTNEMKYIIGNKQKVIIANNTLNFNEFQEIKKSKSELKEKYELNGKKVLLSVARWDDQFRKPEMFPELMHKLNNPDYHLIAIGPGISDAQRALLVENESITFLDAIYSQSIINEYYKLADLFVMPGAIGLAINHAFYFSLPIIIEDVPHSPEVCYLKEGENGYLFKTGSIEDFADKVLLLLENENELKKFGQKAKHVISTEGSFEQMVNSFLKAIL